MKTISMLAIFVGIVVGGVRILNHLVDLGQKDATAAYCSPTTPKHLCRDRVRS